MAGKRRSSKPVRATTNEQGEWQWRPSPPVDFKGKPPMIVTIGADLDESRRLQAALEELRRQYGSTHTTDL